MRNASFDVSIPQTDPSVRWVIGDTRHIPGGKLRHIVRAEDGRAELVQIIGPLHRAEALVEAYNARVEEVREASWADADGAPPSDQWCQSPHPAFGACTLHAGHTGPHWSAETMEPWTDDGSEPVEAMLDCQEGFFRGIPSAGKPPVPRPDPLLTEWMEHC